MAKRFAKMSRDERAEVVREEMKTPGNSNKKVAAKYKVNPGVIAGIRRDYGIPSTNEAPSMGAPKPKHEAKKPARPPPQPKKEAPKVGTPPIPVPFKQRVAASAAVQCEARDENSRQCGWERAPGSRYCRLPHHQALEKKHPARR